MKREEKLDDLQNQINELREEIRREPDRTYWGWYKDDISQSYVDFFLFRGCGLNGDIENLLNLNRYWKNAKPHVLRFWAERIMEYEFERINGGWLPDWKNRREHKYSIRYNNSDKKYQMSTFIQIQPLPNGLYLKENNPEIISKLGSYPFPDGETRNVLDMWFGR